MEEAVKDAQFIRESGPERLPIKHSMLAEIEKYAPVDAIVATSASGLGQITEHVMLYILKDVLAVILATHHTLSLCRNPRRKTEKTDEANVELCKRIL